MSITRAQFLVVWEALNQFVDNSEDVLIEAEEMGKNQSELSAKIETARKIIAEMDATVANLAA
jgi:hypothetical protein